MGTLYMIATPIGNLGDVTLRALEIIGQLDLLLCEDTRVTVRLLNRHGLKVPLQSYREQVHGRLIGQVVERLRQGQSVGYVSDAGTPGIADPGSWLVRDVLAAAPETRVVAVPGPSALAAALSVSGLPAERFVFLGFPPHKKGRLKFIEQALAQDRTAVLYESTHRIRKLLESISRLAPERQLCLVRELTKIHETVYRGPAADVLRQLERGSSKGEFVVIIAARP